jgi:CheY-like chemotaxis protein
MKVLVIENDYETRAEIVAALTQVSLNLRKSLATRGLTHPHLTQADIHEVHNRDAALKLLEASEFDLILLDVQLPASDEDGSRLPPKDVLLGFDVLSSARKLHPSTEIILLAADFGPSTAAWREFQKRVQEGSLSDVPDDILLKELFRGNAEFLQRKIAFYLIDLSKDDENILRKHGIEIPPHPIASHTRMLLRKLKRISWFGEHNYPPPDIILIGERGTGKATLARAFHLLRPIPLNQGGLRLAFEHIEMAPVYRKGGDPIEVLVGSRGGSTWSIGALLRTTFYTRNSQWVPFPGQEVWEPGKMPRVFGGVPNERMYPSSRDRADFDASGTLYIQDILTARGNVQDEIEEILNPARNERYVTTRGQSPLRLHTGPSVILGETPISDEARLELQTLPSNIGALEIKVPPLRERGAQEKLFFLELLVGRRHRLRSSDAEFLEQPLRLEESLSEMVGYEIDFRHNLDDFQAIANQVLPEERSISWRHISRTWERDKK